MFIKKITNHLLFKYIASGVISTIIEIVLYKVIFFFIEQYTISHIASYVLSAAFNFILSKYYVFNNSKNELLKQLIYFTIVVILSLAINTYFFMFFIKLGINDLISKFISIAISVIFNFFVKKIIVFRK